MFELITPYAFSGVPYITYDALEEYAEGLVQDFSPERLQVPGKIDIVEFLECYLGLAVKFYNICYDRKILGMTAFNDGQMQIINEKTGLPKTLPVKAGTVIIDTSLSVRRNEARRRFTMAHEGGHWLLNRKAFSEDNPFIYAGSYNNQYLAAKEGCIDYSRSRKDNTDNEIMERQADFLASAILMPISALRIAYRNFFKENDDNPRRIIKGKSVTDDYYAQKLPEYIAEIFNVSKRAALIRLEKLTAIVGQNTKYDKEQYVYIIHGAIQEFMASVAYRRTGRTELNNRKIIKCPYCAKTLTDVNRDTAVALYRAPKRNDITCHLYKKCSNCKQEVGILMK